MKFGAGAGSTITVLVTKGKASQPSGILAVSLIS